MDGATADGGADDDELDLLDLDVTMASESIGDGDDVDDNGDDDRRSRWRGAINAVRANLVCLQCRFDLKYFVFLMMMMTGISCVRCTLRSKALAKVLTSRAFENVILFVYSC